MVLRNETPGVPLEESFPLGLVERQIPRGYSVIMLILNNCELEERLLNEWEEVMSSVSSAKRLDVEFHEPDDDGPGSWVWTDENGYHFLIRNSDDVLLSRDTDSFSSIEFLVFRGPILQMAARMDGDEQHNIMELCKTISPAFNRRMMSSLEDDNPIPESTEIYAVTES